MVSSQHSHCTSEEGQSEYATGENANYISDWPLDYRLLKERWINCSQKTHHCARCHREQYPGSVLCYLVYILDGDFFTEYHCLRCRG